MTHGIHPTTKGPRRATAAWQEAWRKYVPNNGQSGSEFAKAPLQVLRTIRKPRIVPVWVPIRRDEANATETRKKGLLRWMVPAGQETPIATQIFGGRHAPPEAS